MDADSEIINSRRSAHVAHPKTVDSVSAITTRHQALHVIRQEADGLLKGNLYVTRNK